VGVKLCHIEKHRLGVFDNRVLTKKFETKRDNVRGGEDYIKRSSSTNIIRVMKS
jgi:hypothetical protein